MNWQLNHKSGMFVYREPCITCDYFIILMLEASRSMHYYVEANALALPYKKTLIDRFGGFNQQHLLPETLVTSHTD
jgi:hypothetical protein